MTDCESVLAYHERTKHHYHRFAPSPGYLDWATQPDPFRRFARAPPGKPTSPGAPGAQSVSPVVPLVLTVDASSPSYDGLYRPGSVPASPVCFETVSAFFELSLALSAWKEIAGSRWVLRINPSSGNLHPTEGYLVIGAVEGLCERPAVFHYAPKEHALEQRTEFEHETWKHLSEGFPNGTFFVGLSSIHWREAWKYGERAYRYCQHDVGHALGAIAISAAVAGWNVRLLDGVCDGQTESLLGLDRSGDFAGAEREHPDLLMAIIPVSVLPERLPVDVSSEAVATIAGGDWTGSANALSRDHIEWETIDAVAEACTKHVAHSEDARSPNDEVSESLSNDPRSCSAAKIIRQRRSAVAMDGKTSMSAKTFFLMLDRVMPREERIPFNALAGHAHVHLGLFVHLVEGIPPGLYVLVRANHRLPHLKAAMHPEFRWEKPPGCSGTLPLYLLAAGDVRAVAWQVSCDQQIAGASAVSCGMIAEF
ncbi:MAG: nitroreductase family protein, partial [Planctomycetes bacterium]|nr:nitroreductase family protein [Planctomycetota bacterium]